MKHCLDVKAVTYVLDRVLKPLSDILIAIVLLYNVAVHIKLHIVHAFVESLRLPVSSSVELLAEFLVLLLVRLKHFLQVSRVVLILSVVEAFIDYVLLDLPSVHG